MADHNQRFGASGPSPAAGSRITMLPLSHQRAPHAVKSQPGHKQSSEPQRTSQGHLTEPCQTRQTLSSQPGYSPVPIKREIMSSPQQSTPALTTPHARARAPQVRHDFARDQHGTSQGEAASVVAFGTHNHARVFLSSRIPSPGDQKRKALAEADMNTLHTPRKRKTSSAEIDDFEECGKCGESLLVESPSTSDHWDSDECIYHPGSLHYEADDEIWDHYEERKWRYVDAIAVSTIYPKAYRWSCCGADGRSAGYEESVHAKGKKGYFASMKEGGFRPPIECPA